MVYHNHYSKKGFWDDYYQSHPKSPYDWLQQYSSLKDIFRKATSPSESKKDLKILDIGCGTSQILENLYKDGYNKLIGIDFCREIINYNKNRYKDLSEFFEFFEMDGLEMDFFDCSFDKIIDKGLLDCVLVR